MAEVARGRPDRFQWLSDQSTFSQFHCYARHVRRPSGERYNPRYVVPTVKQAPTSMVWGYFSGRGSGTLWFMPKNTTINGAVFLGIRQDKLQTHMGILGSSVFQHDGASCHRTTAVTRCPANEDIEVLGRWPRSSPDLNPIENLWTVMKQKVSGLNSTSEKSLTEVIKKMWVTDITPAYCEKLAKSMPTRIRAVLAVKGQHTKY